jgi:soluble lytic murein transglycosylase-like protein
MRVRGDNDLATEFAAIGGGAAEPPVRMTKPSSKIMPSNVGRQLHTRGALADALPLPAPTWSDGCRNDGYLPNPTLPVAAERRRATWYASMVSVACETGVPVILFDALLTQESRYNPAAISPKGASGISQLMPDRARQLGVRNVWNPIENMRGGAHHLRALLDEFGRFDLALAAYNAGEGRVRAARQVPRIRETVNYVSGILLTMRDQLSRRLVVGERNLLTLRP